MAVYTDENAAPTRYRLSPPRRLSLPLIVVSVGFVLAEIFVITPLTYLSWDEALYISQFSRTVPAMDLDAHRSLGVPLLVAPMAAVTQSVPAIRLYLSALSGVGLFLAYRPWLSVGRPEATLAALVFASLSVTLTSGNAALPNLFAALATVAGVGHFLGIVRRPGARGAGIGLAAAFAVLSLVRPTDAVWIALPLFAAVIFVPSWRRRAAPPAAAIIGGLATGGAVWVVEAYARFTGPLHRLGMIRDITDAGPGFVLVDQVTALGRQIVTEPWDGLLLARVVQWSVVASMLFLGLWVARRTPRAPAWTLAAASAASVAGPYLILLSYPSGRYLLPGAALVALPIGGGLHRVLRPPVQPCAIRKQLLSAGVAMLLLVHIGSGVWVAHASAEHDRASRRTTALFADRLRDLGLRPPCRVSGSFAPQVAYLARCSSGDIAYIARRASVEIGSWQERHPETVSALTIRDLRAARAHEQRFVVVARSAHRPDHLAGWPRIRVLPHVPWYAYFPPRPTGRR